MKLTVLDRTWEIEVWPASPEQAPNAVYIEVRHKPRRDVANLAPHGIRFGLTETEVNRIAYALVEAATGNRARDILGAFRENAERALINSTQTPSRINGNKRTKGRSKASFYQDPRAILGFHPPLHHQVRAGPGRG